MMALLWAKLWKYIAALGAVLAVLGGLYAYGYHKGAASVQAKWDAVEVVQAKVLAAAQAKSAVVTERVVTKYVDRVQVIHEQAKTIIQKVPVYVSPKADAACTVPVGFARLHDAAAAAVLPGPAGPADDSASGLALSAVASTVVDNYGTCHETAARLTALQDWVKAQASP